MIVWMVAAIASGQAACDADPDAAIERAILTLEDAWDRNDEGMFDNAIAVLTAGIGCLDSLPSQERVARIHRAMALASFANGQTDACTRSLAAARLWDPGWTLPPTTYPPGHPYVALYAAATEPGPVEAIAAIRPERWVVDGVEQNEAPSERAFLLQVTKGGTVVWSGYLWNTADLPDREEPAPDHGPLHPVWSVAASVNGGALISTQDVDRGVARQTWESAAGTTVAAGGELVARFQPVVPFAVELAGSVFGPADPVLGGGSSPTGRGVLVFGGAGRGDLQPYVAARVGGGVDRARAWTTGTDVEVWTVPSLIAGAEAGIRTEARALGVTADGQVVFDTRDHHPPTFYAYRLRIDGTQTVAGPFGIVALVELRHEALPFVDQAGARVGRRQDLDVHLGAGVNLRY